MQQTAQNPKPASSDGKGYRSRSEWHRSVLGWCTSGQESSRHWRMSTGKKHRSGFWQRVYRGKASLWDGAPGAHPGPPGSGATRTGVRQLTAARPVSQAPCKPPKAAPVGWFEHPNYASRRGALKGPLGRSTFPPAASEILVPDLQRWTRRLKSGSLTWGSEGSSKAAAIPAPVTELGISSPLGVKQDSHQP